MNTPPIVSPQEWNAAREELLVKEKELTRARDALAANRRRMPRMAVEKEYKFDGPEASASLLDLGELDAPPVLLIMGVGAQLPMWPDGFCAQLVKQGYRVIRFDHRDTGLSTKMHGKRADGSVYPRVVRYVRAAAARCPTRWSTWPTT